MLDQESYSTPIAFPSLHHCCIAAPVVVQVAEKKVERLSDADIDKLFCIELPIQLRYRNDGGRIRVSYEAAIVDRQA